MARNEYGFHRIYKTSPHNTMSSSTSDTEDIVLSIFFVINVQSPLKVYLFLLFKQRKKNYAGRDDSAETVH